MVWLNFHVQGGKSDRLIDSANTRHWHSCGLMLAHPLRRWPNTHPTYRACHVDIDVLSSNEPLQKYFRKTLGSAISVWLFIFIRPDTICWLNVGLLFGQRLRRWPNSKPTLDFRLVIVVFFIEDIQLNPLPTWGGFVYPSRCQSH